MISMRKVITLLFARHRVDIGAECARIVLFRQMLQSVDDERRRMKGGIEGRGDAARRQQIAHFGPGARRITDMFAHRARIDQIEANFPGGVDPAGHVELRLVELGRGGIVRTPVGRLFTSMRLDELELD
jgi:hypothetical protein